jgi:hypothetical protein
MHLQAGKSAGADGDSETCATSLGAAGRQGEGDCLRQGSRREWPGTGVSCEGIARAMHEHCESLV